MWRARVDRAALVVGAVMLAAACSDVPSAPVTGQPAELTALPRALTAQELQVLDASTAFSFVLWNRLNSVNRDSNVFVSPLSASFALGMTMSGAANETFNQMRATLQFGAAAAHDINAGYRSLIKLLISLDPKVEAAIANSIWYRNDFQFNQAFFDSALVYFGAKVGGLNFSDGPGSLATINAWVSANTGGKIPTILSAIDPAQVMILINAIYFKADWRDKFDAAQTTSDQFLSSSGAQSVRLMHRTAIMAYAESPDWQAVDIPYGNGAFTMTVVLPKQTTDVEAVAASFTPPAWNALTSALTRTQVNLALPKLTLGYERTMNDDLRALGMVVPFVGDAADFTPMSPAGNHLFISFVKQKTFVEINEDGTTAAAATAVGVTPTSAPVIPVMRVDRPYLFVIREHFSGAILFMGKIVRMPPPA